MSTLKFQKGQTTKAPPQVSSQTTDHLHCSGDQLGFLAAHAEGEMRYVWLGTTAYNRLG